MASPDPCLKQPSAPKARWGMVTLCFAATAINYLDRTNLSLAVPAIQHEFKLYPDGIYIKWVLLDLCNNAASQRLAG